MYKIYIRFFRAPRGYAHPGELVEDEVLMQEIPMTYPERGSVIEEPKVKTEMGKAGSFEFSMEPDCIWYPCMIQLRTLMRVTYDDETLFYGRVLSMDTDMWGKRKVHCEGALAFLIDTLMAATKEDDREEISVAEYIRNLIDTHNSCLEDDQNKRIELGQVPGHYTDNIPFDMKPDDQHEFKKFGTGSWTTILNCLEDLTSQYGGYLRIRYDDNTGKMHLDWLRNYFNPQVNNQPLRVSENIIDMSGTIDVNNIFTVLIPEGTKNGTSLYLDYQEAIVTKTAVDPTTNNTGNTEYDPPHNPPSDPLEQ